MDRTEIKTPFFMVNTKSYLCKEKVLEIAKEADRLAEKYDITVFMIAPHVYLGIIQKVTNNLIITAQHVDGNYLGRGMGDTVPEFLRDVGVTAAYMNHAEHPMTLAELVQAIHRTKETGILSVVCSDTIEETKAIAMLNPDIILCEQTNKIETGTLSDNDYMKKSVDTVKKINPSILVELGARICSGEDVYKTIMAGADGTGSASQISCSDDPAAVMEDMLLGVVKAREELEL